MIGGSDVWNSCKSNDNEEIDTLTYSWENGTGLFVCSNFNGTFRRIDVSTC